MYIGQLPQATNRASYKIDVEARDQDTGDLLDLTGLSVVMEIVDPLYCLTVLSATTANGKITIPDTGVFEASFTRTEMSGLLPKTYDVGITIADSDDTSQLFAGTLKVINGVVQQ